MDPLDAQAHGRTSPDPDQELIFEIEDIEPQEESREPVPMPTDDGVPDSRTSSPSITERMRTLASRRSFASSPYGSRGRTLDSHDDESDRSRDGSQQGLSENIRRPPSIPEPQFLENAMRGLHQSLSIEMRLDTANSVAHHIGFYSTATIMTILSAAQHLGEQTAEPRARRACFRLVEVAATNASFTGEDRRRLFDIAKVEVIPGEVYAQIRALRALTKDGAILPPIQDEFVSLLAHLLLNQYQETSAARKKYKSSQDRSKGPLAEERGLFALLELVSNTLTVNADAFNESKLELVVERTVSIAEKTISRRDMQRAVNILRAVVEHTLIPKGQLHPCIEVLCAIANAIPDLKTNTVDCLMLLLRSPDREIVVQIRLATLSLAPNERHAHTVGGALMVLLIIVSDNGSDNLPVVKFAQLVQALDEVHFANRRTRRDCLKTLSVLVHEPRLVDSVLECNWENLIKIILTATGDENYIHDKASEPVTIRTNIDPSSSEISAEESASDRSLADEITTLLNKLMLSFNPLWYRLTPEQRQAVSLLYFKLRLILPKESLRSLIEQLSMEAYFDPGSEGWQNHQLELLRLFVWDQDMDVKTHTLVLEVLSKTVPIAHEENREHFHTLVLRVLNNVLNQLALPVANELAEFAALTWKRWQPSRLGEILERFWPLLNIPDMTSEGETNPWGSEIKLNKVSLLFVKLFLEYLPEYHEQSCQLFEFLTEIAKASGLAPSVRVPVLRLLVRLRCDSAGRLLITEVSDSLGLAATLSRTEETIGPILRYSLDRPSLFDEPPPSRQSRTSVTLNPRTSKGPDRASRPLPTPPLWMYPGTPGLPQDPPKHASTVLSVDDGTKQGLRPGEWLIAVIDILQQTGHWEVYSYVVVHLPSQLAHPTLFTNEVVCIKHLRSVLVSQLLSGKFQEPLPNTNVSKGDVAICLFHSLTMLLAYSEHFSRGEQDDIVRAFLAGIGGWERTAKTCIQALAVCCHQIPWAVTRSLTAIVQKMSQIITQSNLAIDILEFLGGLARLPELYATFREDEFRTVFAVCVKYLEHAREQRQRLPSSTTSEADYSSNRTSGLSVKSTPLMQSGQNVDAQRELPQYVFALAYNVITAWFLSLKLMHRSNHVGWITANLAWKDPDGNEYMEEQSQVTLDMMHRVAYLDLGESSSGVEFMPSDGIVLKKNWLVGMSIVTVETAVGTGLTQITKRQASGTTYGCYQMHIKPLPAHHVPLPDDTPSSVHGPQARINIFPNHIFLQLTSTIAPTPVPMEPICLPDDDSVKRAISAFDRNDTVDGYKVGVIYIGNGQEEEAEILANTEGSRSFELFLKALGTKVPLKDAKFNSQGLDREMDLDGTHTYAWRDRIAEIVFHVPTMMPTNLEQDPDCVGKKRHIGNDFVNIIFNESGLPFRFDTFPSQFNCVNIVITPDDMPFPEDEEARQTGTEICDEEAMKRFYTVHTVSHPSFPLISPAAMYKLLPLGNIPGFARQIALQSSIFSNVWTQRAGGEVISSWRNRLREIHKLRERFVNTGTSTSAKFPGAKGEKTYVPGDLFRGRVQMGGLAEEEGVLAGLDFSRWAGPNPPLS